MSFAKLADLLCRPGSFHGMAADRAEEEPGPSNGPANGLANDLEKEPLELHPDGSLVRLARGTWFVCFVPAIDRQWWHPIFHRVHKHVFALRPVRDGEWTLFEPWWTRLLTATISEKQALKFLRWGTLGDVLLVREAVPGHSSQLRGMMTCGALVAHLLGRRYFVWTPHQLYRVLRKEPNVCHIDVRALLRRGLDDLVAPDSRTVAACPQCQPGRSLRPEGAAKPFCMGCGRDLEPGDQSQQG